MYDALWADWYFPAASPALENLFFSRIPAGTSVLDVCCGSGHVTAQLVARGYQVTGVDIAPELIAIARERMPAATFVVQDVRNLDLGRKFEAALSTFDSLNHILAIEELEATFRAIRAALLSGAVFVFDMNLEEAYFIDLREWHATVAPREVRLVRGDYDLGSRLAFTQLMWFKQSEREDLWERKVSTVYERAYTEEEISATLRKAGFTNFTVMTATEAGVSADLGFGRVFYRVIA